MDFDEILERTIELLKRQGRVSYGALKRRFEIDDEYLDDLKIELIEAQQLARDENNKILVWDDASETASPQGSPTEAPSSPSSAAASNTAEAERRQLTVMFCDLVGSTSLSGELDPEDLREVVREYQQASAQVIQYFDGHIAQYLGDGLLIYFGYPQAHEDDAQRAVRSGLGIVAGIHNLNTRLEAERGVRLAVRIGIHTGLAVVGAMGGGERQEQLAMGETPNIAARIEGLAAPDTVAISAATARLVQSHFVSEDLGTHELKGVTAPMQVFRVLREVDTADGLDTVDSNALIGLVGREAEFTRLMAGWESCKTGRGQVLLLSGEAGIGKSHLVSAVVEFLNNERHSRVVCRCSSYYQNTAFYPVVDSLERLCQFTRDDTPEAKLDKLERTMRSFPVSLEENLPLFAGLLSLPHPADRNTALTVTPQRQRQLTLEALVTLAVNLAHQQPVVFIVEDLHWIDPSTSEWLSLLIERASTVPFYILLTHRPEFIPPWAPSPHITSIALGRLNPIQVDQIIAQVADDLALPREVLDHVRTKTDGVPLFVEELTKMFLESELLMQKEDGQYALRGPLPANAIPSTLQDSLMARLDRLSSAKVIAQLGATIGRQFTYELIRAVSPMDENMLQQCLQQLVDAELLHQSEASTQVTYVFRHALIQDAAYESLLRSTRQTYHEQIAQVLTERFAQAVEAEPELIAHHYTEAGLMELAIQYWLQAGQRAARRSALVEASSHLTQGLTLVQTLRDTQARTQHELEFKLALGPILIATKGYSATEVKTTFAQARELCEQLRDASQLFVALRGLWAFEVVHGDMPTARTLGEQLLTLAEQEGDDAFRLEAHRAHGLALLYIGDLVEARFHFDRGLDLYDPQQHGSHAFRYGNDPGVVCLSYGAKTQCLLGYPDQALRQSQQGIVLAESQSHPFTHVQALAHLAMLYQLRQEPQRTYDQSEVTIAYCDEQSFPYWKAIAMILQGWARVYQGQYETGVAQLQQGLETYQAIGAGLAYPWFLSLLAHAYHLGGQSDAGLDVIAQARSCIEGQEERFCEAEIYRLQGELLLGRTSPEIAASIHYFEQALTVSRRQQAKWWELKASTSLARQWQHQGKQVEARELLAPIVDFYTEGFETGSLQDARRLLDALHADLN